MPAAISPVGVNDAEFIDDICTMARAHDDLIRSGTKIVNQAKAILRRHVGLLHPELRDTVSSNDEAKTKSARAKLNRLAGELFSRIEKGEKDCVPLNILLVIETLIAALDVINKRRDEHEKAITVKMRSHPIADWVKGTHGASLLWTARVIGALGGRPTRFRSVSAIWTRMGSGLVTVGVDDNGVELWSRQRKVTNVDLAIAMQYSPRRRSVIWNVERSLVGFMGEGPRVPVGTPLDDVFASLPPYQAHFVRRCRLEVEKNPEHGRDPKEPKPKKRKDGTVVEPEGGPRESYSAVAAQRARRWVGKRFLRDLHREWRRLERLEALRPSATRADHVAGHMMAVP